MAVRALPPCKCNSLIVQIKWCSRRKNGPIPNLSVATGTINQRDYMDEEELARLENAAAAAALQKQWESQDDHTAAQELLPTKCVQRTTDVKLHCKMDYVDFEGRYDGNDLIEILKALRPQKLVIVHADRGSSEFLRMRYSETTRDRIDKSAIFTPTARPPMTIDLTSSRLVRKAKLKDDLFDTVEFYRSVSGMLKLHRRWFCLTAMLCCSLGDEYDVGYVDAFVCNNRDPTSANTGNESNADADDAVWLDQPGPPAKRYRGHAVTMIGDIELSKLAVKLKDAELVSSQYAAELSSLNLYACSD
eukprot:SAG31_NODE_3311_length_4434_cov_79.588005_2_plen_304_part_00